MPVVLVLGAWDRKIMSSRTALIDCVSSPRAKAQDVAQWQRSDPLRAGCVRQ